MAKTRPTPSEARLNPTEPVNAIETLTPKQAAFVKAMTSPDSPTFGNQTRSYMEAYGTKSYVGSGASAVRIVQTNANVAVALREEIERQGLGAEVRVGIARDIIAGRHRAKTRTVSYKEDDKTITETESSPRAQDVTKVLALLDRWDGSDMARQAEGAARTTALRELTKRIMATLPPAVQAAAAESTEAQSTADAADDGTKAVGSADDALLGRGEGVEGSVEHGSA